MGFHLKDYKIPYLFATGMFRSGTTLTSKILNAHPQISFASDPYRPFFNDFRDRLAELHGLKTQWEPHMPLDAYFCDDEGLKLMKIVQNADLNVTISRDRLRRLLPILKKHCDLMSPKITKQMHRLKGRTYREVYISMMALIHECYGKKGAKLVGMKEGWSTEFVSPLARTFPGMKFILVVRDPRGVFASNRAMKAPSLSDPKTVNKAHYPWLFLVRQWRKLAILSWLFSTSSALKDSVRVLRYEDLTASTEESARKICDFLKIDFSPSMVDGRIFLDGWGKPWTQNSSYNGVTSRTISTQHRDKWKTMLKCDEVRLIERLCYAEMRLFGHEPVDTEIKAENLLSPPILTKNNMAEWIKRYSSEDPIFNSVDMTKEFLRKQLSMLSSAELRKINPRLIEGLYVDRRYFEKARQITKNGKS